VVSNMVDEVYLTEADLPGPRKMPVTARGRVI
jgi:hypothetical protein